MPHTVAMDYAIYPEAENAMNEIYLSWQSCVGVAYDRYGYILEEKKAGRLKKKKTPTDYLVQVTAKSMSDREKVRQV